MENCLSAVQRSCDVTKVSMCTIDDACGDKRPIKNSLSVGYDPDGGLVDTSEECLQLLEHETLDSFIERIVGLNVCCSIEMCPMHCQSVTFAAKQHQSRLQGPSWLHATSM